MDTNSFDGKVKNLNQLSTQLINLTITINDLQKQQNAIIEAFKALHSEIANEVQNRDVCSSPGNDACVEP